MFGLLGVMKMMLSSICLACCNSVKYRLYAVQFVHADAAERTAYRFALLD